MEGKSIDLRVKSIETVYNTYGALTLSYTFIGSDGELYHSHYLGEDGGYTKYWVRRIIEGMLTRLEEGVITYRDFILSTEYSKDVYIESITGTDSKFNLLTYREALSKYEWGLPLHKGK